MKIKNTFMLRQIAGTWIAMTVGENADNVEGVLSLNDSGVLLWKCLEHGCDLEQLVSALTNEYDIDRLQAMEDAKAFVEKLRGLDCLE